jgi:hypothetical protein
MFGALLQRADGTDGISRDVRQVLLRQGASAAGSSCGEPRLAEGDPGAALAQELAKEVAAPVQRVPPCRIKQEMALPVMLLLVTACRELSLLWCLGDAVLKIADMTIVEARTRRRPLLLTAGMLAAPTWILLAMAQAATRTGFDPTRHPTMSRLKQAAQL